MARDRSVDRIVRQAIEEGKFDNLKGKGKPLNLNTNAFADPEWQLAFNMLQKEGFALPWMEKRKDIEGGLERARANLARSWHWRKEKLDDGLSDPKWIEGEWMRAKTQFEEAVEKLNKLIKDYNLEVPADVFMRAQVNVTREINEIAPEI